VIKTFDPSRMTLRVSTKGGVDDRSRPTTDSQQQFLESFAELGVEDGVDERI